jgi:hypothetical protein
VAGQRWPAAKPEDATASVRPPDMLITHLAKWFWLMPEYFVVFTKLFGLDYLIWCADFWQVPGISLSADSLF